MIAPHEFAVLGWRDAVEIVSTTCRGFLLPRLTCRVSSLTAWWMKLKFLLVILG
jgi:hypothetical protein